MQQGVSRHVAMQQNVTRRVKACRHATKCDKASRRCNKARQGVASFVDRDCQPANRLAKKTRVGAWHGLIYNDHVVVKSTLLVDLAYAQQIICDRIKKCNILLSCIEIKFQRNAEINIFLKGII